MKITRETVHYVAELAKRELGEAEPEIYRRLLDDILTFLETLNQLDTSGAEAMAQVVAAGEGPCCAAAWLED